MKIPEPLHKPVGDLLALFGILVLAWWALRSYKGFADGAPFNEKLLLILLAMVLVAQIASFDKSSKSIIAKAASSGGPAGVLHLVRGSAVLVLGIGVSITAAWFHPENLTPGRSMLTLGIVLALQAVCTVAVLVATTVVHARTSAAAASKVPDIF